MGFNAELINSVLNPIFIVIFYYYKLFGYVRIFIALQTDRQK